MQTMDKVKRDFALHLFEIGAVKINTSPGGGFRLKLHEKNPDAPLSPFYLNIRMRGHKDGPLTRHDIGTFAALMARQAREGGIFETSKFVTGVPEAGEPLAGELIDLIRRNGPLGDASVLGRIMLRKSVGTEGRSISGIKEIQPNRPVEAGNEVIVFDDLITGAGSKAEAISILREHDFDVKHVVVGIDREQGGAEELARMGVQLHAVYTFTEMLELYVEESLINAEQLAAIQAYRRSN